MDDFQAALLTYEQEPTDENFIILMGALEGVPKADWPVAIDSINVVAVGNGWYVRLTTTGVLDVRRTV